MWSKATTLLELLRENSVCPFSTCVEPCCGFQVPLDRSTALHVHTPAELRAQAAHARELAKEMFDRRAQADLLRAADELDSEADELERREGQGPIQKPIQDT